MNQGTDPILVGIDLAKDSFTCAVWHPSAEEIRSFLLTHEGLADFCQFLDHYGPFPESFVFGLEATGPYTNLLLAWLVDHQARVHLINPLLIYRFAKAQSLRRAKTDAIDAHTIAAYMAQATQLPKPISACDNLLPLAHEYEQITDQIARIKTQLRQQLHSLFPELAGIPGLFARYLLSTLLVFPSARAIRDAQPDDLLSTWSAALSATGKPPAMNCQRLSDLALHSIGVDSLQREFVLQSKIRQLLHLLSEQKILRDSLAQAVRREHPQAWHILSAIPGLGPVTVAMFLAQVHSIDRFPFHKQLIAYVGTDPTVYESGQYRAPGHISKRGSPHLRKTLYLMAQSVIRYTETFANHFDRLVSRGKPYRVAVIATANKLLRVMYALLTKGVPFQDTQQPTVSHS